jgi:hypothetical protein
MNLKELKLKKSTLLILLLLFVLALFGLYTLLNSIFHFSSGGSSFRGDCSIFSANNCPKGCYLGPSCNLCEDVVCQSAKP